MQRARAAERHERVIARIVPAFDGDDANGFLHHGVGHVHDSLRELFD